MDYVVAPSVAPLLPVRGSDKVFPVGRVFCVGRNYAEHISEMGGDPDRELPFFFCKPLTSVVPGGGSIPWPGMTAELHHEVELAVALGEGGRELSPGQARDRVYGYAVGIDLTRRDLQAQAKAAGRPWETAKGFDGSAPVGELVPVADCGWLDRGGIELSVDGVVKQSGDLAEMIWKVDEVIAELSRYFTLNPGDILLTGTPSGVSAVEQGAVLDAAIEGLPPLQVTITADPGATSRD